MPGRTVPVVLAAGQVVGIVERQLLLQRQRVELAAQRELLIDLVLADVEVFHVEEADVVHGVFELLDECLLAAGLVKEPEVEGDEFRPVDWRNAEVSMDE